MKTALGAAAFGLLLVVAFNIPATSTAAAVATVGDGLRPVGALAAAPAFPQVTISRNDRDAVGVEWDLFVDRASGRFVLLGAAGCPDPSYCAGVAGVRPDGGGSFFELTPPRLPFAGFCVDTLKFGSKQPIEARQSFLVLSSTPGRGQPSISVRSDDGDVHVDQLCWPHEGDAFPHLWLGNNWDSPQVMTFAIAGTVAG